MSDEVVIPPELMSDLEDLSWRKYDKLNNTWPHPTVGEVLSEIAEEAMAICNLHLAAVAVWSMTVTIRLYDGKDWDMILTSEHGASWVESVRPD